MNDRLKNFNAGRANFFLVGFMALVVLMAVAKITAAVLIPLVIALLLAFVLEPLVLFIERLRIPRLLAILAVFILLGGGIYVIGAIVFTGGRTILGLYPKYEARFSEIYERVAEVLSLPYDEQLSVFGNLWGQLGVRSKVQSLALSLSEGSIGFLSDALIVLIMTTFLLLELGHFRSKIAIAFEHRLSDRIRVIATDVVAQVSRYLSAKFFISLATGVLVTIGLELVGLDFAIVWGVISFVLNFIPNFGSIGAGLGAGVFALVQFWPEPGPIIGVGVVMLGVNQVIGNFLEPKIMGDNLGLSPFVIVVSLIAWGWLWGFAGLVLAVPMTVIVKIVCENVPILEPASILIGSWKSARKRRNGEETAGPAAEPEAPRP
ncbi:MAG: AI-2E family transporter [Spirochaetia bacterium]|nr:AI-2E family transporter [Spirochaetia bacterium]